MTDILKLLEPAGENATDDIIRQIRFLLDSGDLQPGDKLPAERKLAEKFQVARSQVREAFKKLEFYNIIKTMPQSGSVISAIESTALNSLISDILKMDNCDFHSLVEARSIIEINAAKLCAIRRTEEDLKMIESAMNNYNKKIKECGSALEEDLYFHRTIAEGSKNTVLKSMMMTITPDIMVNYAKFNVLPSTSTVGGVNMSAKLEGFYEDDKISLAFRRLSIIDLSNGHQPMFNEDSSMVILFNGEIYNYQELKEDLMAKGHVFANNSDTETILHGYEEYGQEITKKLRGMFAFVIWDIKNKVLFGARDNFGIKPFYYYNRDGMFIFGSEIKSFLPHPKFKKELNENK